MTEDTGGKRADVHGGTSMAGTSKRGTFWIIAGLALAGLVAGYRWWRGLPR